MKRPIVIAVIGYIIGIIWGLYIKISIVPFCALLFLFYALKKFIHNLYNKTIFQKKSQNDNNRLKMQKYNYSKNIYNIKKKRLKFYSIVRCFRYFKLIFNRKVIITIIIFSTISNTIILLKNQKYDDLYKGIENIEVVGIIQELKNETQYNNVYKLKVIEVKDLKQAAKTYLYINVKKQSKLRYGDIVKLEGKYVFPKGARNYGGFSQKEYYKTLKIYGTVNVSNCEKISNISNKTTRIKYIFENISSIFYSIKDIIKEKASKNLDDEAYPIYFGLILGDTSQIDEQTKEQFKNSNLSHILAISGMHISYIILGLTIAFGNTLGKKKSKIITIMLLIFYNGLTGFSPSIMRASIMGIIVLLGSLLHRKSDMWTTLSLSLFVILIYNPYLITSVSLQYTYAGTIGILLFRNNILQVLNKGKENKSKIKDTIAISLSAQIFILPLTLYHFNTFGMYFLLTNLLINFIIGPIIILCFVFLILIFVNVKITSFISFVLNLSIKLILTITNIGYLPFSKLYIRTPRLLEILSFCFLAIVFNVIYSAKHKQNPNFTELRIRYMLEVIKYRVREKRKELKAIKQLENSDSISGDSKSKFKSISKKNIAVILIILLVISLFFIIQNAKELKIHFVDVGQGDCTFIETPNNKTILLDGGGSEFGDFDVGKSTLLPYILDRGYTKIDYIIISHFDSDHVGRITNNYAGARGRKSSYIKARRGKRQLSKI